MAEDAPCPEGPLILAQVLLGRDDGEGQKGKRQSRERLPRLGSDLEVRCRGVDMMIITKYLIRAHTGTVPVRVLGSHRAPFSERSRAADGRPRRKGTRLECDREFLLLSLPHTIALTLPMAILVSVLYTFSELTAANEITAMSAGGIRPLRILLPLLGVGTILAGVMLFFHDQVLPEANHRLKNLIIDISQKSPTFELRERVINEIETEDRGGSVYLQAATIDRTTNELTEVVIYDLTRPERSPHHLCREWDDGVQRQSHRPVPDPLRRRHPGSQSNPLR